MILSRYLNRRRADPAVRTRQAAKEISAGLFEAQKNLRILSAIAWDTSVEPRFRQGKSITRELRHLYDSKALSFTAPEKLRELTMLEAHTTSRLGKNSPLGSLLLGRITDYRGVVELLSARGQPEFSSVSRRLWGSTTDQLFSDGTTVIQYAKTLQRLIKSLITPAQKTESGRVIPAVAACELMKVHFRQAHLLEFIDVVLSTKITANAAACVGKIKLRKDAMFSVKDIEVLIYHEAYTHVATATNGRAQRYAKFLGFDSPRCTSTQEGLAVLMEIFSNTTYPQRILKIADRVIAVHLAEQGADPHQVYDYLTGQGYSERESFQLMCRVFRGTNGLAGQAFTKDVAYLKGLIECFNFIQYCLVRNKTQYLPFLFAGKLNINEMPAIYQASLEHLIQKPKWVPVQFQDLDALSSWFICTAALGQMGDAGYHQSFDKALSQ